MSRLLETKQVLRDKQTNRYFKPNGRWTRKFQEAAHFKSLAEVVAACETHGLTGGELVLRFRDSAYNDRLNLSFR